MITFMNYCRRSCYIPGACTISSVGGNVENPRDVEIVKIVDLVAFTGLVVVASVYETNKFCELFSGPPYDVNSPTRLRSHYLPYAFV